MGDPKQPRKKYHGPTMVWEKERIEEEKKILKEYGIKNKKEIWKLSSSLKRFKDLAKKSIAAEGVQADKEKKQLIDRLVRLGLVKPNASLDDILGLTLKDILERRLQTIVVRLGLARSARQARQFITHQHIIVGDRKITSPSYIVSKEEELKVTFVSSSALSDPEHPEREKGPKKEEEKKDAGNK